MGRRARHLGERLRAPTAEGLGELLRELEDLEARRPRWQEGELLAPTVEVTRQFRGALEALEDLLGHGLPAPGAPSGGWGPVLRRAGIEEVLRDPGGAARVHRLFTDLLPGLQEELRGLARDRGVLARGDGVEGLERTLEALGGYVMERGEEVVGLNILLSAYHLVLSVRLARLVASSEGKE